MVPNLRVLMMGKNRLKVIENLECLKKLDVLDLHRCDGQRSGCSSCVGTHAGLRLLPLCSNEIEQMQNLNELRELRVLNLGGNKIVALEGVDKLSLLNELNLRRNAISRIGAIGNLASLQRLFLSNNKLETLEAIEPLFQVVSINELRLDVNAVCESGNYRARMIQSFPALRHLDLRALSDADRQEAAQFFASPSSTPASQEQDEAEEAHRAHAVSCIRVLWSKRESLTSTSLSREKPRPLDTSWVSSGSDTATTDLPIATGYEERELKPSAREDATIHNNNTGFSEIEVHGDHRVLAVYGNALDALESTRARSVVNCVAFRYIDVDKVSAEACAAQLKLFSRLRRINLAHNDLRAFAQLSWLAGLGSKAEEVSVERSIRCA